MAFLQFKFDQVTFQSRDIFNTYIYETDDTIAEVLTTGYFDACRFAQSDDWVGSIIQCKCSDGFVDIEIGEGGEANIVVRTSDVIYSAQTLSDAVTIASRLRVGSVIQTVEYNAGTGIGGNSYALLDAGSSGARPAADGGSIIHIDASTTGLYFEGLFPFGVMLTQFGVVSTAGVDNSAEIAAALAFDNLVYISSDFYVSAPILLTNGQSIGSLLGVGIYNIIANDDFVGSSVLELNGTRTQAVNVRVNIPTSLYDPDTQTGTVVDGITTTGDFYHQLVEDCVVTGGRRAFHLSAKESKIVRCQSITSYDAFYIDGFDVSVFNITATDPVNLGLYSDKGVEGNDIHLVRCGGITLSLLNQIPVNLTNIFIDTPSEIGIQLNQTNGANLTNIYFSKVGENVAVGTQCFYFKLINSSGNYFKGGAISFGSVDQTNKYFYTFADSGADSVASANNVFDSFRAEALKVAPDNTKKDSFTRQLVRDCTGTFLSSYSDFSSKHLEGASLAAAATKDYKIFLPTTFATSGFFSSVLVCDYVLRTSGSERQFGTLHIQIPSSDGGSNEGVFSAMYTRGVKTFSLVTLTGVVYDATARTLSFTVTNGESYAITLGVVIRDFIENVGSF